jgi:hypothetical protein
MTGSKAGLLADKLDFPLLTTAIAHLSGSVLKPRGGLPVKDDQLSIVICFSQEAMRYAKVIHRFKA